MKNVRDVEKSLKSFLKKRITYTSSLLVIFLITGSIGLAAGIQLVNKVESDGEDLIAKIEAEKAAIQALLDENEAKMEEIQNNYYNLVRQGDYYSKPVYPSDQIFFSFLYEAAGKHKNRTAEAFKETLDAAKMQIELYGAKSIKSLTDKDLEILAKKHGGTISAGDISMYLLEEGEGTIANGSGHSLEIDMGANITPLVPMIAEITKEIDVSVPSLTITVPVLNFITPFTTTIGVIIPPSVNVSVTAPSALTALSITLPIAPSPTIPPSKVINFVAPNLPNDYEPTMLVLPDAPTTPVINVPTIPLTDFQAGSIGNSDVIYADDDNGYNAFVTNVAVLGGKFNVARTADLVEYDYRYTDYNVYTYIGGTTSGITVAAGTVANLPDVAVYKHFVNGWTGGMGSFTGTGVMGVTISLIGTYNNGDWLVSRELENSSVNLGEFLHMDNHGAYNSFIDMRVALDDATDNVVLATKNIAMNAWDDAVAKSQAIAAEPYYTQYYDPEGLVWLNTGNITLEGGNMSLTNQYSHNTYAAYGDASLAINTGDIIIRPYINGGGTLFDSFNAGFLVSNDNAGGNQEVMYNSGNIYIHTNDSAAFVLNSVNGIGHSNSGTPNAGINAVIVNRGHIEMTGKSSLGIFARSDIMSLGTLSMDFTDDGTNGRNPIILYGDESMGLYIANAYSPFPGGNSIAGNFHVDIGAVGIGNKPLNVAAADTNDGQAIVNYYGDNDSVDLDIQGTIGMLSFKPTNLTSHGIIIYDMTKGCIGIVPLSGANLVLGTGKVQLNGGENNIGMIASDIVSEGIPYTGGNLVSEGYIDLIGGDRNIGAIAKNGFTINVDTIITSSATNSAGNAIGFYADGIGSTITATKGIGFGNSLKLTIDAASLNNHTTMAALATNKGIINADLTSMPAQPNIEVIGLIDAGVHKGYALLSNDGVINVRNNNITIDTGAAGIIALNGGEIYLQGGKVDYSGRGFAVYTDSNPATKIYLTNGEIVLRGKSVGFTLDVTGGIPTSNVVFGGTAKITMMSNDAVALNLTGIGIISLTDLVSVVQAGTGSVQVIPGIEGATTYNKYRLAATDGGNITIDVPIDKTHDSTWGTYDPSFFFFRSFLAQKSILTISNDIIARLNTSDAVDYYKGYVSGIEMNSSLTATSANDSMIILNNGAEIFADRTDAGEGAVGVYLNFGYADIGAGTKINVETGANVINDGGIGIYGVDGAVALNNGEIKISGNRGVGLLGLAYRLDELEHSIGQEFGGISGEGVTTIINDTNGKIDSKGNSAIGIYEFNNSDDPYAPPGTPHTTMILTNNGIIEVGTNVGAKNAVGIYTDGDIKVNIGTTSSITVGEEGIGIYVANESELQSLGGTINLGRDGIGIISDGSATISATGTFIPNGSYIAGENGKIAIAYVSKTIGVIEATPQTLLLNIDVSAINHGTGIYIKDKSNLNSTGNISVGTDGAGIYLSNGSAINTGAITLQASASRAVGMYSSKGNVTNAATGIIAVNNSSQIGIVGLGSLAIVDNIGAINLSANGSVGVLLDNEATLLNQGTVNFGTAIESFAIVANKSIVTLSGSPPIYTMNNIAKNIYVYGTNGSTVNLIGNIIIDGVAVSGSNKSVGIFLDGTLAANTVTATGSLEARNGSVAVYSKSSNNLFNGTYIATGDQTVAVYFEDDGSLNGTNIYADAGSSGQNAVGVYAAGGGNIIIGPLGIALNLGPNRGTGLYLSNGASVAGGLISITNTSTITNPGLYYIGVSATHGTDLELLGSNTVGLYANAGVSLSNNKNIIYSGTSNLIGAYIGGTSTYTSTSIGDNISTPNSAGIFVADGTGINKGEITISTSTGAAIAAKGIASKIATIENQGDIIVDGGVGFLLGDPSGVDPGAGRSIGKNKGTIEINNGALGAALSNYDDNMFDGTGGIIRINDGTGIYLENTGAGDVIATGHLDITSGTALGIYADGSVIDFPIILDGTGGTGVYAIGNSTISSILDGSTSTATVGLYLNSGSLGVTFNNPTIKSGVGIASVGIFLDGVGTYALQNLSVVSSGNNSIGVYVANTSITDSSTITVATEGIGLYIDSTSDYTTNGNTLNIGTNGAGIYNKGTINLGTTGPIAINFNGTNGFAVYNDGGTINIGNLITIGGTDKGTFAATVNGSLSNSGTIGVSNGSIGLIGKYTLPGIYSITNFASGIINVGMGGIGMAATGTDGTISLINSGIINVNGQNSIGIYTDIGNVINNSTIDVTNDGIAIFVKGTGSIGQYGTINVAGGVGLVVEGGTPVGTGTITLNSGTDDHYSIGAYYINASGTLSLPSITLAGNYTIEAVVDSSTGVNLGTITVTGPASNQVGYLVKNSSATAGTINVTGDNNLGIFGDISDITTGNITVGDSTDSDNSSVGIFTKDGSVIAGSLTVGKDSVGIYGNKSINISTGAITVDDSGVGIYAIGNGTHTESIISSGNLSIANKGVLGIYSKGADVTLIAPSAVTIGNGTSIGVASAGIGNVLYSGNTTVADKGSSSGSIVIYKRGAQGNITSSGDWNIGTSGYGLFLIAEDDPAKIAGINVTNNASMTLGESAVGIYADATNGKIALTNSGTIDVGSTYLGPVGSHSDVDHHENSVGIYLSGGANGINTGTIIVDEDHSVGVYASGIGTYFENSGTMTISNGSIGILAKSMATITNSGTITLLNANSVCGNYTVGIAVYSSSIITNTTSGIINAGNGIGVYVAVGGKLSNYGTINIANGIGIQGLGVVENHGSIMVTGTGIPIGGMEESELAEGSIKIDQTGIMLDGNYISIGGTFRAESPIILGGAFIDITTLPGRTTPLFSAPDVSGTIYLTPNFAKLGNGFSYKIDNFVSALSSSASAKISIATSPMFIPKELQDGSLLIAKKPYADLAIGKQFKELHDGLDSLLYNSIDDGIILKNMNAYLEGIYSTHGVEEFNKEASRTLSETRGDIYTSIQSRMQDVQHAFDNSFNELFTSYNISKDSGKYSVMYTQGRFRDDTIGVDDYDYRVQGLMYMNEFEGRNYGNKWGYTVGFAASRFDFDDAPTYHDKSKEDIYSLRGGMHLVHNFNNDDSFRWISRVEIGYNRHIAERSIEIDKTYKNKASYNSYNVSLDNKLEKTVYRTPSAKIDIYAGLNLEYGAFSGFSEKEKGEGGALLTVKNGDYFSIQPEVGVQASKRKYIGKKLSAKITGNLSYAHELGNNYNENKAKVKNGTFGNYTLIRPEKEKGVIKGNIGFTIEKANKFGVTFDVEARKHSSKDKMDLQYGVRIKYVF
ncbi:MAG: autotransporter-associated N-terminal domain-containing protein [Fusobacteriaceae bacterium]|jgi:hypothetical protein|nr:autotransporter-associated N-terminal domain-containing protein [Fusobacteriaceae bacterium]